MKLTDTQKAALILTAYVVGAFLSLLAVEDARLSVALVAVLTLAVFLIFHSSWRIERTEKRTRRYIEAAGKTIRREHEREVRR